MAYMQEYFPEIALGPFLPSGGTGYDGSVPGTSDRPIDLLFAATYVAPRSFDVFIDRNGPEYSAFYHSILGEALAYPAERLERIVKRRMEEEIEEGFTKEELRLTLGHIQFLDYYVRYSRRAAVVRAIADYEETDPETGEVRRLSLTIVGSGWESFVKQLKHPERITILPYADSREVLRLMTQSKLALNVLPSFHEGAHDRIYNAMLCGAVCVTDSNPYLDTFLSDGENAVLYQTPAVFEKDGGRASAEALCRRLSDLLRKEAFPLLSQMADAGRQLAGKETWRQRAALIAQTIRSSRPDGED
jgi:hypothetical protein